MQAPFTSDDTEQLRHVRKPLWHDWAGKHVQGVAEYIDDIRGPEGTLHVAIGKAAQARGRLAALDLSAVRAAPEVVAVLTAADVPGTNDISPAAGDDPMFAEGSVSFHGQALFAVVARTRDAARRAAALAEVMIETDTPGVTIEDALRSGETVMLDYAFGNGDAAAAIAAAPCTLEGEFRCGGQEHFYLEGQIALAVPGEDGSIHVYSSTQHPTEVQHIVARVLNLPDAFVTCEVRRMGGAFGGKESQASQWAAIASLAARMTNRPCKLRLDRDDDFILIGKRHDFRSDWRVGISLKGRLGGFVG